jgi:(R,R)-butanediol dehydrogenase/meso-butanediol dehydrogenase/diacetyl reductase
MRAIVYEDGVLKMRDMPEPSLCKGNNVKIKIYGTGICGTDLNVLKGKISAKNGMILGHEAVGTVTEIGEDVTTLSIGDRVIIDPTQYCGKCDYCRQGLTCYCTSFDDFQLGIGAHGTFAEYYVGEERFLYKIPDNMNWDTAILIEPLTCVLNIIEKAKIQLIDSVLVIGAGPIGVLCQMLCKKVAQRVVSIELNDFRRDFSKQFSDFAFSPDDLDEEIVKKITDNNYFGVIIDAVGNQLEYYIKYAAKGARLFASGFDNTYEMTVNTYYLLSNGISIIGTGEVHQLTSKALSIATTLNGLDKLVTHKVDLDDYQKAFNDLINLTSNCKNIKTVLLS